MIISAIPVGVSELDQDFGSYRKLKNIHFNILYLYIVDSMSTMTPRLQNFPDPFIGGFDQSRIGGLTAAFWEYDGIMQDNFQGGSS